MSAAKLRADLASRLSKGGQQAGVAFRRQVDNVSQKLSFAAMVGLCATPLLFHTATLYRGTSDTATAATSQPPSVTILKTHPLTEPTAPVKDEMPALKRKTAQAALRAKQPPRAPAQEDSKATPAPTAKVEPSAPPAPPAAAPQATPATPAAPAVPPPAPDVWTEAEIASALKTCMQMLGPIAAQVETLSPIKQEQCGTAAPVSLKRLGPAAGSVELNPPAVLNCPMVAKLYSWLEKTLQPAARETFGAGVVRLNSTSGYVCRGRNGDVMASGKLSEHALANAIDIQSFTLSDGRIIDVGKHWGPTRRDPAPAAPANPTPPVPEKSATVKPQQAAVAPRRGGAQAAPAPAPARADDAKPGLAQEAQFLRRLHQGACTYFGTVLGPEANEAHREHFHFDLHPRRHSNFCQ